MFWNYASSGTFRGISSTFGTRLAFHGIGNNNLDPEDLLEEDRHIVEDYTLAELAAATTDTRVMWEESMIEGDGVQKSRRAVGPMSTEKGLEPHK